MKGERERRPVANLINIYPRKLRFQGRNMGYFQVRYDSRVVIYKHKMFIRLATDVQPTLNKNRCDFIKCMCCSMLSLCVYYDLYGTELYLVVFQWSACWPFFSKNMRSKATIFFGSKRSKLNIQKSELAHTLKRRIGLFSAPMLTIYLKRPKIFVGYRV